MVLNLTLSPSALRDLPFEARMMTGMGWLGERSGQGFSLVGDGMSWSWETAERDGEPSPLGQVQQLAAIHGGECIILKRREGRAWAKLTALLGQVDGSMVAPLPMIEEFLQSDEEL